MNNIPPQADFFMSDWNVPRHSFVYCTVSHRLIASVVFSLPIWFVAYLFVLYECPHCWRLGAQCPLCLQQSAIETDIIEVDPDTKEMLKMLVRYQLFRLRLVWQLDAFIGLCYNNTASTST